MNTKDLVTALKLHGLNVDEKTIDLVLAVSAMVEEKGLEYDLKDYAKIQTAIAKKHANKHTEYEYAIIPLSFRDYDEYVNEMNRLGKEGWIIRDIIETYTNSPEEGVTTHDHICRKIICNKEE